MTPELAGSLADGLAAVLRGESVAWRSLGVGPAELLAFCAEEDLTGLVHLHLGRGLDLDWPQALLDKLTRAARIAATQELLRREAVVAVLDALAAHDVHPILLKGTPLAYTAYEKPNLRPRGDTDLFVRREQADTVCRAMTGIGYAATNYSDGELLFCQFEMGRTDAFGVVHAFDVHWKISTQAVFADLFGYDELARGAIAVPALGAHARAAGPIHALLLACVHPVMHHRSVERLIWLYDIHVLAQRCSRTDLDRLVEMALGKGVAAICAHELALARSRLGTPVPEAVLAALAARPRGAERSAEYLQPERQWSDELLSSIRALPHWSGRLRLLREIAFPAPGYMLRAYGLNGMSLGRALLPALYAHRGVQGVWKVLRNRK